MRNRRGMTYDSIVIGGGAAGLSAALVLGRARKRTLLVDAGEPSNLPAHAIGGLLGQDGRSPADFYAQGREQLAAHPSVELREDEVTGARRDNGHFALELASGETHHAAPDRARHRHRVPHAADRGPRSRCGATPSSTARSATAGRSATSRSRCSATASRATT